MQAKEVIDAKGKIVIPGIIDPHVHIREPGLTHKEDFQSGSRAAAKGGITTFLDMPNTMPPTTNAERLEEKRRLARKSVVNYGFHFGSTLDNLDEIKNAKNIASVKIYMDPTTGDLKIEDLGVIEDIFKTGRMIALHAEGDNIKKIIEIIKKTGKKAYFCHVSSEKELQFTQDHETKNNVLVEVTPQHLFLTSEDAEKLGSLAEMKPRLKARRDQEALWKGIREGTVDTIGTDHAPHLLEEKRKVSFPYGIPGLETMLPLMLNAVNEGRLELKTLVKLCCENPAKIFKIKSKGFIKEGYDADLTIVDMPLVKEVKNEELETKCKWSPFNGWKLKGWPVMTIVNGNIVFDGKEIKNIRAKEVEYGA